jgi:hypothetical protein
MANFFKNYVALFIFSGLLFAFGILTLPPLKLPVINFVLAIGLFAYLALFLFGKLSRAKGVMFTVLLVEFVLISLIATGLLLSQASLIKINGVCRVVGISLWIHSAASMIGEFHAASVKMHRRTPIYIFALHLGLSSFGIYIFAAPFISDKTIAWIASAISFALGALCLIFAIIFAARGKKKATQI